MVLIRYYGQVPMEKFGPRGAVEQWREYIASPGATPWGAMSLLVGHLRMLGPGAEEGILPQVEEKLGLDERDLAIDLAEKFGSAGKPDS